MIPATNSYSVALALAVLTYVWNWNGCNMNQITDDGRLWVGNIAAAWDKGVLQDNGITHVVSVTQFGTAAVFHPEDFVYHVIDIQDVPESNIQQHLESAVAFIADSMKTGRVLVHCNQGRSRSVTVAAAYLARHKQMDTVPAIEFVRARRPEACPNPGFIRQLHQFCTP